MSDKVKKTITKVGVTYQIFLVFFVISSTLIFVYGTLFFLTANKWFGLPENFQNNLSYWFGKDYLGYYIDLGTSTGYLFLVPAIFGVVLFISSIMILILGKGLLNKIGAGLAGLLASLVVLFSTQINIWNTISKNALEKIMTVDNNVIFDLVYTVLALAAVVLSMVAYSIVFKMVYRNTAENVECPAGSFNFDYKGKEMQYVDGLVTYAQGNDTVWYVANESKVEELVDSVKDSFDENKILALKNGESVILDQGDGTNLTYVIKLLPNMVEVGHKLIDLSKKGDAA